MLTMEIFIPLLGILVAGVLVGLVVQVFWSLPAGRPPVTAGRAADGSQATGYSSTGRRRVTVDSSSYSCSHRGRIWLAS
jgi:hypothetical protein